VYYHLYAMIDIFSRSAVHFEVHATELGELAKDFITEAVRLNGGIAPHAIHPQIAFPAENQKRQSLRPPAYSARRGVDQQASHRTRHDAAFNPRGGRRLASGGASSRFRMPPATAVSRGIRSLHEQLTGMG
jgi:hypothetical protein